MKTGRDTMGRAPFPPLPTVSSARPLFRTSASADGQKSGGGAGVDSLRSPCGRLGYSQRISPVNAPPETGADGEYRPHNRLLTTQLLCKLSYISEVKAGQAPYMGAQQGL